MDETAESKMFSDSRTRLSERYPKYRVFGVDMAIEVADLSHELAEFLRPAARTTHVLLVKFADMEQPRPRIHLAVFEYALGGDDPEFVKFDAPDLTDEWKIKFDQMFRDHVRWQGKVLEMALRALRTEKG